MNRLYRSRTDRMLAGVSGGLANLIGIDPSLVRIGWVVLAFASGGLVVLLYILMAIIVPEEPEAPFAGGAPFAAPPPGDGDPAVPGAAAGWAPTTGTSWSATASPDAPAPAPPRRRDERTTALVIGAILVLAGVLLLLRRYIPTLEPGVVWPVVLVALGVLLLIGSVRRR